MGPIRQIIGARPRCVIGAGIVEKNGKSPPSCGLHCQRQPKRWTELRRLLSEPIGPERNVFKKLSDIVN